jgi:hypothetical protein
MFHSAWRHISEEFDLGYIPIFPKILKHISPFKEEAQTTLFKDPVRTAL